MVKNIDVRKDKSVETPEFIQELRKIVDKYSDTFLKDDTIFIYSKIGDVGACISSGRTLSQVTGLAQIMDMREDVLNMIAHAIIRHLKNKNRIDYTCALLSNIMDNACPIPEMAKLYEKLNVAFLDTYSESLAKREKVN